MDRDKIKFFKLTKNDKRKAKVGFIQLAEGFHALLNEN